MTMILALLLVRMLRLHARWLPLAKNAGQIPA